MKKVIVAVALVLGAGAVSGVILSSINLREELGKSAVPATGGAEENAAVPSEHLTEEPVPGEEIDVEGKVLADAIGGGLGEHIVCEFASDISADRSVGVIYVDGDRKRIASKIHSAHASEEDYDMLWDKENAYAWGPAYLGGAGRGMKFTYEESIAAADPKKDEVSYEEPISRCTVWEVDETMFELPRDVVFMTGDELSDYLVKNPDGHSCGLCDYYEPALKAKCLRNYDCD